VANAAGTAQGILAWRRLGVRFDVSLLVAAPASFPRATLRALLDRLIPRDDLPGAIDAGVETYVLRQLSGDCAFEAGPVASGLAQLDAEAAAQYQGHSFATLNPEQQDALLHAIDEGRPSTVWPQELSATAFFARMVDLAHEGFYADPGNGGNRDAISWRMIGYDPRMPAHPGTNATPADSPTCDSSP
jgi:Gluconate 2-dehydrogenase subunit 3